MASKVKPSHDDSGLQIIKREEFSDDEDDDDFEYQKVEDTFPEDEDEDDELTEALASMQTRNRNQSPTAQLNQATTMTQIRPSVVDDFIRNFMIKAGMKRSLETFNAEWYELQSKGKLSPDLATPVPDIYLRNEDLDQQAKGLREQVENMRVVATKAQSTWDKFRKERDFHRMHHKRVVQEKNKLITDLRRLRDHLRAYEPAIDELKRKYDTSLKDKALIKLERDRLKLKVKQLEEDVNNLQNPPKEEPKISKSRSATRSVRNQAAFPLEQSEKNPYVNLEFDPAKQRSYRHAKHEGTSHRYLPVPFTPRNQYLPRLVMMKHGGCGLHLSVNWLCRVKVTLVGFLAFTFILTVLISQPHPVTEQSRFGNLLRQDVHRPSRSIHKLYGAVNSTMPEISLLVVPWTRL